MAQKSFYFWNKDFSPQIEGAHSTGEAKYRRWKVEWACWKWGYWSICGTYRKHSNWQEENEPDNIVSVSGQCSAYDLKEIFKVAVDEAIQQDQNTPPVHHNCRSEKPTPREVVSEIVRPTRGDSRWTKNLKDSLSLAETQLRGAVRNIRPMSMLRYRSMDMGELATVLTRAQNLPWSGRRPARDIEAEADALEEEVIER